MLVFRITVSCFLVICVVNSVVSADAESCDRIDRDMKNVVIDTSQYCKNNNCIYKCCTENKIFNNNRKCEPMTKFKKLYKNIKYMDIPIFKSQNRTNVTQSNKRLTKDFVLIYNNKFVCHEKPTLVKEFHILENTNATFPLSLDGVEIINEIKQKYYCVEYKVKVTIKNGKAIDRHLSFVLITIGTYERDIASHIYSIGMLISCFFLFLLLLVYGLLPKLHNIGGMVLMAYVSSLILTYLVRAGLDFAMSNNQLGSTGCKTISPVLYFAALSKFCWLNVMSYDLFWAFRGTRKCRAIHRQGEKVKFMWYCLYAWGVPLLITIAVVILDNTNVKKIGITTPPPFSNSFNDSKAVAYYLYIPIGIIIVVNTLLFCMTAYNIWLIKREIKASPESRNTKKDINNFIVHLKLAVMMGISWSIEILQNFLPGHSTWWIILLNSYHVFIGVVIFFLFVFKKKILIMLCKKFHINNHYTNNLQQSYQYSKSGTEPKSRRYTFKSSRRDGP